MTTSPAATHGPAFSAGLQQTVGDYPLLTTLAAGFLSTIGVTSLLKSQALVSGLLLTGAGVVLSRQILREGDDHWDQTRVQIRGLLQGLRAGVDPSRKITTSPVDRVCWAGVGALAALGACMLMGASLTWLITGAAAWIAAATLKPRDAFRMTGDEDEQKAIATGRAFGEAIRPFAVVAGRAYAQVSEVFEGFNGAVRQGDTRTASTPPAATS